jgi:hypothetical protein
VVRFNVVRPRDAVLVAKQSPADLYRSNIAVEDGSKKQ